MGVVYVSKFTQMGASCNVLEAHKHKLMAACATCIAMNIGVHISCSSTKSNQSSYTHALSTPPLPGRASFAPSAACNPSRHHSSVRLCLLPQGLRVNPWYLSTPLQTLKNVYDPGQRQPIEHL